MAIFTFDAEQQLIKSDNKNVRILLVGEEKRDPWFRGNDVAYLLGYSNQKKAVVTHVSAHRMSTLSDLINQGGLVQGPRKSRLEPGPFADKNDLNTRYINKDGFLQLTANSTSQSVAALRDWVQADGIRSYLSRPSKKRKVDNAAEDRATKVSKLDNVFAEGQCIEKIVYDGVCYYKGNDIARVLGYQNQKKAIRMHVPMEYVALGHEIGLCGNNNMEMTRFINETGVSYLVYSSRKPNSVALANGLGIPLSKRFKAYSHELHTITTLMKAFKGEKMIHQHRVGNYRLDLYFPEYNLAVECDEMNHSGYDKREEETSQQWITA